METSDWLTESAIAANQKSPKFKKVQQKILFDEFFENTLPIFSKTIILKEENLSALESRMAELMKYEDEKLVIFGIFSTSVKFRKIIECFLKNARPIFKTTKSIGRIWCAEVNGTGKGCGIIAADDKIKIWKDRDVP